MSSDCLFCRIVAGDVPSTAVYDHELVYGFRDVAPIAPTHVLVVPKRHIVGADEIAGDDGEVLVAMFVAARAIAESEGIAAAGYRTVFNVGRQAGQTVMHLHLHVVGGRNLAWPPG
ncbi:MAG TPA: histidine triad nucleotide-binding protein [Acidimicrobiales bacterium]|nr:histidine triad nucleotide-binding protein [Acidimicrobiales bacterium]